MTCRIILTDEAKDNLAAIANLVTREQISNRIETLKNHHETGKSLRGKLAGYRSLRAARNRYRIIYRFVKDEGLVVIIAIGMRRGEDFKDVYKSLERLFKRSKREK